MAAPGTGLYRPDIDGLRAIAVLAVVFFHIDELWISAGFIGVDIFFTISGFLITGILVRSYPQEGLGLGNFYRNRIRRILPVLTVVILATLIIGQLVLLPKDLKQLAGSAIASELFVGNFYFTYFQDTSYFARDARLEPLLHLWSLGVEEQFYLLWPVLLIAGKRYLSGRALVLLVVLGTLASFVFGQYYYSIDPMFAYYMLPGRAGQLLAGALCYFTITRGDQISGNFAACLAFLGLGLIGCSLWQLSPANTYPGFNAVPVTLGTVLVIYGGATANPVSSALSVKPLVTVGLLSYSIYLWHWPVLSFARYLYGPPGLAMQLLLLAAIFLLSWLSYQFVETPFRKSTRPLGVVFVRYLLIPSFLIAGAFAFIDSSRGLGIYQYVDGYRSNLRLSLKKSGRKAPRAEFVCQPRKITAELFESERCLIGNTAEPDILLWGDSNAAHYVGAFKELGSAYDLDFRNIALGACPPIFRDPGAYTHSKAKADCEEFIRLLKQNASSYKLHIISGNWSWYLEKHGEFFEVALEQTITELQEAGVKVILLGRIATLARYDRHCEAKALKVPSINCSSRTDVPETEIRRVNDVIKDIANRTGSDYLDFNELLCRNGTCYGDLDETRLYFDTQHLSEAGSAKLGQFARDSGFRSELCSDPHSMGQVNPE